MRISGWSSDGCSSDLLAKAHATDVGCLVTSLGVQVHGGMGYIEETGAAQYFRDARITPIYEGTNGIQAADLVGRKLPMAGGAVFAALIADRSEEHTSELQSLMRISYAVFCLKKKQKKHLQQNTNHKTLKYQAY